MTSSRAVLHVGLPKTGTSFLQGTVRANAAALGEAGLRLPGADGERLFEAVLAVTGRAERWGRSAAAGQRTWAEVVREARAHAGTTLISSETLCLASPEQVARVVGDLEGDGVTRVEVVVTVRDLARQLPAEWQEGVKHGRRAPWDDFLATVLADPAPTSEPARGVHERFWRAQDPTRVLDRWSAGIDPDRVHVVVSPPPGAPRDLLWSRFAEVLGVVDVDVEVPEGQVNTSLGHAQTEVLRRVNRRVTRQGNERAYGDVVKRLYAGTILRGQGGQRVTLPAAHHERVAAVAETWVEQIAHRGHRVAGDLDELRPAPSTGDDVDLSPRALLQSSLDATGELLREVERLRAELAEARTGRGGRRGRASEGAGL